MRFRTLAPKLALAGALLTAAPGAAAAYDHATCLKLQKDKAFEAAAGCLRAGAEAGDPRAQFNLGFLYVYGQGVPKDHRTAMDWFHEAAKNGDVRARLSLAFLYDAGPGVEADDAAAGRRYRIETERSGV